MSNAHVTYNPDSANYTRLTLAGYKNRNPIITIIAI